VKFSNVPGNSVLFPKTKLSIEFPIFPFAAILFFQTRVLARGSGSRERSAFSNVTHAIDAQCHFRGLVIAAPFRKFLQTAVTVKRLCSRHGRMGLFESQCEPLQSCDCLR
jgi:hypothetical protein